VPEVQVALLEEAALLLEVQEALLQHLEETPLLALLEALAGLVTAEEAEVVVLPVEEVVVVMWVVQAFRAKKVAWAE
jgi:hypothetical protein